MIEYRVFGPPGCGKTTWLARNVGRAVEKHGASNVIVASFTKAAAEEVAGRDLPIDRQQIGTLHAHAYRAIGRPAIAEVNIEDWNTSNPQWALSGGRGSLEDAVEQVYGTDADELHAHCQLLRAKRVPEAIWPESVIRFWRRWSDWKAACGYVDFTDMIERALHDTVAPVGSPTVGFYDEAQDFTSLELALVRHWAESQEYITLAGDDDQCLYSFKGSTPDAFLSPIPDEHKRVLSQSYRVPRAVQAVAQSWIEGVQLREPKAYLAREEEGTVRCLHGAHYKGPGIALKDALVSIEAGKSVMFLASCGYMLDPLKDLLRSEGIPFHNPYRRARGDWNPLGIIGGKNVSARERILAFLRPQAGVWGDEARMWNGNDLAQWAALVKGVIARGKSADVGLMPALNEVPIAALLDLMSPESLSSALDGDLEWLMSVLAASKAKGANYPLTVAYKRGGAALKADPLVTIGTIHSVKGGQADVVYVFPDLSAAGAKEWQRGRDSRDAIIRLFYVAMTRARQELVFCEQSTRFYPPELERVYGGL